MPEGVPTMQIKKQGRNREISFDSVEQTLLSTNKTNPSSVPSNESTSGLRNLKVINFSDDKPKVSPRKINYSGTLE